MDEAGVDKAAIVHSSTAYGYDNSYVADAVAAVPSRFTGVCSIDVMAPDAVKTFDYWLTRGCTGMRLFTTGSTLPDQATWFVDPKAYPFWEHAAAKNIPVCMQMSLATGRSTMALTCYGESSQDATLPNTFSSAILQRRITMKHFEFKQAKQGRGARFVDQTKWSNC
jgi:predicted TIM-barrel fold metal-dependent hydrolase